MANPRYLAMAFVAILAVSLTGCVYYTPKPGETIYVEVVKQLTVDEISRRGPTLMVRNALANGATRDDIKDGRIANGLCAEKTEEGFVERYWTIQLPRNERFAIGGNVSEFAEIFPGAPDSQNGPLSQIAKKTAAPTEVELRPLLYRKLVACDAAGTPGAIRVKMTSTTNSWDMTQYDKAEAWIHALPQEPLANGRLFLATCGVGTQAWLDWYIEVRPDQTVKAGDIVKARAGNDASEKGGTLSQVIELNVSNLKYEKMFNGYSVRCSQ